MIYNLEGFTKVIQTVQNSVDDATAMNQFAKTRSTFAKNDFFNAYAYVDTFVEELLDVLTTMFDDNDGLLEWWCWELDFGRKWEPDSLIINGKDFPVRTAEEIYAALISNRSE